MTKIITRLFDRFEDAQDAVTELERTGVPHSDISIIAGNAHGAHDHHQAHSEDPEAASRDAAMGASAGAVLGGGAGVLAGLGLLAVPGLGPVVAAGWLVSMLAGAATGAVTGGAAGGLIGALTQTGVSAKDADVYSEGVRRGGTLVTAKVEDAEYSRAEVTLDGFHATDTETRGTDYQAAGWVAHDPAAHDCTSPANV